MVLTLEAVRRAADALEMRTYQRPAVLRTGARAYLDVERLILQSPPVLSAQAQADEWSWLTGRKWAYPANTRQLYGLEVLRDEWLAPDAWQLTDADATLLYDCRMRHA